MSNSLVTINLAIYNGDKYIRQCLDSVLAQSYPHENIEINIWNNASTDNTAGMIKDLEFRIPAYTKALAGGSYFRFAKFFSHNSEKNLGMWPAQEELLKDGNSEYVVVLSVDVILHPDFIKNAVEVLKHDFKIGALQARVYKFDINQLLTTNYSLPTTTIDTLGFQIFRSRRIVNIGHGELDSGQYNTERQIFAVEGAVPVFRRQALEDCRLKSQGNRIVEPDFFWYGDDLDLTWRMRILGWKQVYAPSVIAWHDRKTTKALAGNWKEFIKIRKTVPMFKRRLDWRNTTLTIIKNDFAANWLRDLLYILRRQIQLWAYFLIFEPVMFIEVFKVAKLLPKMLKRRREIMQKSQISAKEFRKWIR